MSKSVLKDKSYLFAIRAVRLSQFLQSEKKEYVLSKQILRCGTAVGALLREAEFAQSTLDFIHKVSVALKDANEFEYWLNLINDTGYITSELFISLQMDIKQLIAMLVSSIKTLKLKQSNETRSKNK
ncbi:MAG: four helix bundle protein [Ferruginibacter sp.]